MGSCTVEHVARPTSPPAPGVQETPSTSVEAIMTGPDMLYNAQGPDRREVFIEGRLQILVKVHQDPDSQTRLLAEARTYLTLVDGSVNSELVSKVHFSIFSGKPSQCFPGDDKARTKWLQEWHTARLTDHRFRVDASTKEHVYAIRTMYNKDGTLLGPGTEMLAGPHDTDTLIYISKIITQPAFAGKKLLRPMLDLLYEAVTHKDLSALCRLSGPICWTLEPGFINTDENDKMWPLLDGEDEWDRSARVARILKTKVYPKVDYTVYREDVLVPGLQTYTHTYMGRRVYAYPRLEGSDTCSIRPLPSNFPVPEPSISAAKKSKLRKPNAPSSFTETQQPPSSSRTLAERKKWSSTGTFRSSTTGTSRASSLQISISVTPKNRRSQGSSAAQRCQARGQSGSPSSSRRTTTASSTRTPRTVPQPSSNRKRKASELDDEAEEEEAADEIYGDDDEEEEEEDEIESHADAKDDDDYDSAAAHEDECDEDEDGDDDDDGGEDDFVPSRSLARTVRRPAGQPSEGARPTRSNHEPELEIAKRFGQNDLLPWHDNFWGTGWEDDGSGILFRKVEGKIPVTACCL